MINVNGLKRNAKNIVKKYSDAQVKVREATSNDPWGPSSTIMAEIADLTYNVVAFSEIMQMIWKRLNDHGKNWRHVYKALVVLEYLIKTGTEKVAQQCIENIFAIQTLKDFQYMEDNKDHGMNIREKSKKLVTLLKDSEKLKAERARAIKAKSRLAESMSSVSKSSLGSMMSAGDTTSIPTTTTTGNTNNSTSNNNNNQTSNSNYLNSINLSSGSPSGSAALAGIMNSSSSSTSADITSAVPQTLTEEENQLKLALALSKEEAEQQEKIRKNDELRLKLALDVSKKTAGGGSNQQNLTLGSSSSSSSALAQLHQPKPTPETNTTTTTTTNSSTIDDLLGLTIPPPPTQPQSVAPSTTTTTTTHSLLHHNLEPNNDPWSSDPWQKAIATAPTTITTPTILPTTATNIMPANPLGPLVTPMAVPTSTLLSSNNIFGPINNNINNMNKKTSSKNPFED